MQFFVDARLGGGPGYRFPSVELGVSFELPISTHIELQGVSYTPTKPINAIKGDSLGMTGGGAFWITRRFGATAYLDRGHLWTSQFNLRGWGPLVGVAIREHTHESPGRLYVSYVIPTGCQWGGSCLAQPSRTTSARIYWDHRVLVHWRFGFEVGLYRRLNQGDPLDPAAGRTSQLVGDAQMVSRFEFPSSRLDELY
jgi:hypothetical protein